MGCSWKTYRRAANQKMAGCRVCLCLPFCIIPFSTLCLFPLCVSAVGGKSQFYCHYLWNCIPRRWMLSLIFMTSREAQSPPKLFNMDAVEADTYTHIHNTQPAARACTRKRMDINVLPRTCKHLHTCAHILRVFFFPSLLSLFCPKDNAWLVFCSCWWWRVVVTVLLSVGLMHYNTALPCCVNSLSLLIENMEASHLARCTSAL